MHRMVGRMTRIRLRSAASLTCFLSLLPTACSTPSWSPQGQGKLEKATNKVAESSRQGTTRRSEGSRSHGAESDDDESLFSAIFGEVLGEMFAWSLGMPFWIPHDLLEERPGEMEPGYFLAHPYAVPDQPFLSRYPGTPEARRQSWSLRTAAEFGSDFDDIERLGVTARLETAWRFGLDGAWSHFREELPDGSTDTLDLGDVNLTYRFAQAGYGEMRAGFGMNWFADGPVHEQGVNFTYGGDFYLGDPWITSFELDVGGVGGATRFHGRATLGLAWERCELCAGFDYESLDSVGLPSWTLGLRLWF